MVLALLVVTVLFSLWIHMVAYPDDLTISFLWGTSFALFLLAFGGAQLAVRRQPLTIYENGFNAPMMTYKALGKESRFVPYHKIRSIHPIYVSPLGPAVFVGYTIITVDGDKHHIQELEGSKRNNIDTALKSALGDRWDSLYMEAPHLEPHQLERLRVTLSRSNRSVWAEGFGIVVLSLAFLMLFVMQSPSLPLVTIAIFLWLNFSFVGMFRIMSYYKALAYYGKVVKYDPSLESLISSPDKFKAREKDPLEVVKDYTEADWRQLERNIYDKRYIYVIVAGFVVMVVGISLGFEFGLGFVEIIVLFFTGVAIMLSSLAFTPKLTSSMALVNSLVELELEEGRKILPEWFKRRRKFETALPFREAPQFSDDEWIKLVKASRFRSEKTMFIFMALMVMALIASVAVPRMSGLPTHLRAPLGVTVAMVSIGLFTGFFFLNIGWLNTLRSIEAFEEKSGQKVIPEKYRDRITRDWKARGRT